MRRLPIVLLLAPALAWSIGCADVRPPHPAEGPLADVPSPERPLGEPPAPAGLTTVELRNVGLRLDDRVNVHAVLVRGELERSGDNPVQLDQPASFRINVSDAEVRIASADLTELVNRLLSGLENPPMADVTIGIRPDEAVLQGTIRRPVPIPVTLSGQLSATDSGQVAFIVETTEAAGLPVGDLLDLFGVELADLVNVEKRGLRIERDRLILDPRRMVGELSLSGRVFEVRTEPDRAVLFMDAGPGGREVDVLEPPGSPSNYLFLRGGDLKVGRFSFDDTDLLVRDGDPTDLFDLSLRQFRRQLIDGRVTFERDMGIVAVLPDYADALAVEKAGGGS